MSKIIFIIVTLSLLFISCFGMFYDTSHIPLSLEDSYLKLDSILEDSIITQFKENPEDDMFRYHHGLGMWIRNNWGLWRGKGQLYSYFDSLEIFHPDDMSGIILTSYWRHLNNHPIQIEKQVQVYKEYWEEVMSWHPISSIHISEQSKLIQKVIDFDLLQNYYHPEIEGRESLKIYSGEELSKSINASKFGRKVKVISSIDEDDSIVWFLYIKIRENIAKVGIKYLLEGVRCELELELVDNEWNITKSNLIEMK